ncbi:hypothetical protein A2973_00370 [Candidatus Gottesmanbacteria bacterium RIFCSPLOWO2_01_FULL_49_10]|uniref:DUF1648 domain-containing protein n=1 Tax=Candidatus Gottesmanbacteria bacterium RIFCSPLOWO2_01_FULL_49_10 TaxID=1798396 RepID=A0A1F6AYQ0_9BACT|nr:MAG: hypothetical protein UY10_C0012G0004 [Microgenomates group bacterium GW2011_GWA2_47_8]OGG29811.1 MAG: hypothetical protein A2973_00370 [Candidatus Gottesmanbacteria bacterium RIFCSPLOWO2_01_FULL_49_10]
MTTRPIITYHVQHVTSYWHSIAANWIVSTATKLVLVLTALSVLCILWRWKLLPSEVPFWYGKPWGADRLASPYWLFTLPLTSLSVLVVNAMISLYVTIDYLVFTQILFLTSTLVSILSFVTLIKILFLVT